MRFPRFTRWFSIGIALCATVALGGDVVLPDPAGGQINGRVAVLFWPSVATNETGTPQKLLPADGCEVHLIPHDDRDAELRHPCGKWFQPPAGGYNFWLEQGNRMSPTPNVLWFPDAPFAGKGVSAIDILVDAGRVALPTGRELPDGESLRLVSVDSHIRWGARGRIFERRVTAKNAHTPVLMPAGRIIVGRFDKKSGDAIALSRPSTLDAGKTTQVWPTLPTSTSDVLVILEKPALGRKENGEPPILQIEGGESPRRADVVVDGHGRIIAVWYGVDQRKATIALASKDFFLPRREILLRPGKVSTIRSSLQPLPKLSVNIAVPDDAVPEAMSLSLSRHGQSTPLREVPAQSGTTEIADLPAERLRITLNVGRWRFFEDVDLTSGDKGAISFDLEPIVLTGKVYYGDDAVPATIAFLNAQDWVTFDSDERGEYRAVLWYSGRYTVKVSIVGRKGPPWIDPFRPVVASGALDFHVPRTDYVVRVSDATTGDAIVGAQATAGNVFVDDDSTEQTVVLRASSDDSGAAELPPLRHGRLELQVRADGYSDSDPISMIVDGDDKTHKITVRLRPLRRTERLTLLLADGAAAAGAEIWAFAAEADSLQPLWKGVAGNDGGIRMPDIARDALLLVRHARSASMMRRWAPNELSTEWRLRDPAPPLMIAVSKPDGSPARSAHIAVWLDGVKIHGVPLSIATWSIPASDANGIWIARNLPPASTQVLAIDPAAGFSVQSRLLDAMAIPIAYPWPPIVPAVTAQ